jgi:CBS-domain-containing membrane protein
MLPFHIVNANLKGHWIRYIVQSIVAMVTMLIILLFVDSVANAALIAGLGSTVVTAFLHPTAPSARLRAIIGGHFCGLVTGSVLAFLLINLAIFGEPGQYLSLLSMAVSVGFVILLMGLTDTEHPPAAGIAIGMAGRSWEIQTFLIIIIAVLILALIRVMFSKYIKDV